MENYKKGKNIEEPLDRNKIPIPNLPENFLWMHVRGGSKIRILLTHALNEFPESKFVVWTGFGQSVGKAVTCCELMKREYNNELFQITKLCYRNVDEYWDPLLPNLDQLVVKKKLPMIHILLSLEPLDHKELGYQDSKTKLRYQDSKTEMSSKNGDNSAASNKRKFQKKHRSKPQGQSSSQKQTSSTG